MTPNETRLRQSVLRRAGRVAVRRRRGVIMLVVLSMLVLFMLVGTTFLITSSQYRQASRIIESQGRNTLQPEDLLERALMQLLRDTGNRYSAARTHSLLRDTYGVDGFTGRVVARATPLEVNDPTLASIDTRPRYAGLVNAGATPLLGGARGETQGQLVDLYVIDRSADVAAQLDPFSDDAVVSVELNPQTNQPFDHPLSTIDGYYNGCLLTMVEGPCQGDSVRVVDYDYLGSQLTTNTPEGTITLARLRVMAPRRLDGDSLTLGGAKSGGAISMLTDFVQSTERGYEFVVNGRPLNGVGVGFNALAGPGQPQLSTLEGFGFAFDGFVQAGPVALLPHARMHQRQVAGAYNLLVNRATGQRLTSNGLESGVPLYNTFVGPGGADESYDAADFQNMFLALQPPQPRPRGRVVPIGAVANTRGEANPIEIEAYYASGTANPPLGIDPPLRIDLDGLPIPSFHRPALVNYWLHQLMSADWLRDAISDENGRARAILQPYDPTSGLAANGLTPEQAARITAIKRRYILRPLREDHPAFDGSNPISRYANTRLAQAAAGTLVNQAAGGQVTFPYWEAAGPWDVDNDGDGVPDSVWIDMGLPIQKTEDGRLYKPLVAMLVEDLDGRLNLNAHGSPEHLVDSDLDISIFIDRFGNVPNDLNANLAQDYQNTRPLFSSNQLPSGSGWGPADISLRSILSPDLPLATLFGVRDEQNVLVQQGNPQFDDYRRLFNGRPDNTNRPAAVRNGEVWGKWAPEQLLMENLTGVTPNLEIIRPGVPANYSTILPPDPNNPGIFATRSLDRLPLFDFYTWPQFSPTVSTGVLQALGAVPLGVANRLGISPVSGFGTPPDLKARYASAVSAAGSSIDETERDGFTFIPNPSPNRGLQPFALDSPYEMNLSGETRRSPPGGLESVVAPYQNDTVLPRNDDAPFSPSELERLLRAFDADAMALPDRLWNLVDAFDPEKLAIQSRLTRGDPVEETTQPTSLERVVAESQAAINRRSVTTESWDLPVPNENWTQRCLLGADGLPGVPGVDDDDGQAGPIDEGDEVVAGYDGSNVRVYASGATANYADLYNAGCDDYAVIMRADPPANARITDYLRYRATLELARRGDIVLYPPPSTRQAQLQQELEISRRVNNILFGPQQPVAAGQTRGADLNDPRSYGGLLAPEVLAGHKMNLNRPLGDGRDNGDGIDNNPSDPIGGGLIDDPTEYGDGVDDDNNGVVDDIGENVDPYMNGVVDEPGEAGEPFIDLNGDGQRQVGESFRNLDGSFDASGGSTLTDANATFRPKLDRLWQNDADGNANGVLDAGEYAYFDHSMGVDINASGSFIPGSNAVIVDDDRLARQLLARHLYCLMLSVMDENYLCPFDPNDPQVLHYLDPNSAGSMASLILDDLRIADTLSDLPLIVPAPADRDAYFVQEARRIAWRKLTCRQVAQWAVNVVDMRDPDAIQTAFEYDENPWDGWNVRFRRSMTVSYYDRATSTNVNASQGSSVLVQRVYPLDGDIATDENYTMLRDTVGNAFGPIQAEIREVAGDPGALATNPTEFTRNPAPAYTFDQTRGVVWGAERPELLMTEGLAWHDRRLLDLNLDTRLGSGGVGGNDPGGINLDGDPFGQQGGDEDDEDTIDDGEVGAEGDDDLDQLFKPTGPAYVELFNPWGMDDQKPAEFYRDPGYVARRYDSDDDGVVRYGDQGDLDGDIEGVLLDRLTARLSQPNSPGFGGVHPAASGLGLALTPDGRVDPSQTPLPSPVWRIACVEQHPLLRNSTMPPRNSNTLGLAQVDLEVNDDPPLETNSTYLGVTNNNLPWVYRTETDLLNRVPEQTDALNPNPLLGRPQVRDPSANPLQPGGAARFAELPELPSQYLAFWETRRGQARQQIDSMPANGKTPKQPRLNTAFGFPVTWPDPDFPTFDRQAQPSAVPRLGGAPDEVQRARLPRLSTNPRQGGGLSSGGGVGDDGPLVGGGLDDEDAPETFDRLILRKPDQYVERVFYLAGAPGQFDAQVGHVRDTLTNPGVRIPRIFYEAPLQQPEYDALFGKSQRNDPGNPDAAGDPWLDFEDAGLELTNNTSLRVHANRFVVLDEFDTDGDSDNDASSDIQEPMSIAPILPGHFGVVGHPGAVYEKSRVDFNAANPYSDNAILNRYVNVISRLESAGEGTEDLVALDQVAQITALRRIELIPSTNPFRQQVVWRRNGGRTDRPRSSEVVTADGLENVTDPNRLPLDPIDTRGRPLATSSGSPNDNNGQALVKPAVAIPVEGFSISEPLDGYLLRQLEIDPALDQAYVIDKSGVLDSKKPAEGAFVQLNGSQELGGYDEPFDVLPELIENQTTPNYRVMHLQRLANPLLAWNPPPLLPNGRPFPGHDPSRPVNPYMTADSLSLDLTALNGTSVRERRLPKQPAEAPSAAGPAVRHRYNRVFGLPADESVSDYRGEMYRPSLQSQERGLHAFVAESLVGVENALPPRGVWGQERTTTVIESLYQAGNPIVPADRVSANISTTHSFGTNGVEERYTEHAVDYPIRHSLGFPNRNYGKFYNHSVNVLAQNSTNVDLNGDRNDLNGDGLVEPAVGELTGSPQIDRSIEQEAVAPPTFFWPNRPFISEMEVLQAPAWGSSRMLTYYSTFNPELSRQPNYWDGTPVPFDASNALAPANPAVNEERWRRATNPYGHLLPFFQTSVTPATATARTYTEPRSLATVEVIAQGAPHFYRVLDYLHVPSPYTGTDTLLSTDGETGVEPTSFIANADNTLLTPLDSPRQGLLSPFNRVSNYREPGRVNLNTVVGRGDPIERIQSNPFNRPTAHLEDSWSEVYDGLMHRRRDGNYIAEGSGDFTTAANDILGSIGHLGPAWRDLMLSRRGYVQPTATPEQILVTGTRPNYAPRLLHPNFPTFFANPLREASGGENVPISALQQSGVDTSWLRAHPLAQGADHGWGRRTLDDPTHDHSELRPRSGARLAWQSDTLAEGDLHTDDATEAGVAMLALNLSVVSRPNRLTNGAEGNLPELLATDTNDLNPLSVLGDVTLTRSDWAVPNTLLASDGDTIQGNDGYGSDFDLPTLRAQPDDNSDDLAWYAKRLVPTPLFAGASGEPSLDTERNPSIRYQNMTRMTNLATCRSGVFAVWITVGFFEVTPAAAVPAIRDRYMTDTDEDGVGDIFGTPLSGFPGNPGLSAEQNRELFEDLFYRVYQDGYTIGQELDLETGQNKRMKAFYVVDRTRPVAFKPGADLNAENAILLRRRVE